MKKMILAFGFLSMLGAMVAGCGGNACESYADALVAKLEECGQDVPDTGDAEGGECTEAAATLSECLEACLPDYDCACVKDPTGDGCADKLQAYSDCTAACL